MGSRKMGKNYHRGAWFLAALCSLVVLGFVSFASNISAANGPQGLQVSPVLVDLNAEKGGTYEVKITVTNVTTESLTLASSIIDFKSSDESGNPKFLEPGEDSNTFSVRQWVRPEDNFSLKPKESRTVSFTVRVPDDAEAGGHYGVIRFYPISDTDGNENLALTASVGVLLLTRVEGNIVEDLTIADIFTSQNGKRKSLIANGPVTLGVRLKNNGNVHVKPVGSITVKDMLGRSVGTYDFGSQTKNVLPESIRLYEQEFDKRFLFGKYTVNLEAAYGTTGGVVLGQTTFWVIPFKLILFLLVLVAVAVVVLRKMLRRYHRRIIRKSQQTKHK